MLLESNNKYNFLDEECQLLEIGTGWLHWEAITARLFHDFHATLFDVWDNRQLEGLHNYLLKLEPHLHEFNVNPEQRERASRLIAEISHIQSFEEIYELLGFRYIVNQSGRLEPLKENYYDVIVSSGVLEHIYVDDLPDILADYKRVLKPDGFSIHNINLQDHYRQYAHSISNKQYLMYPKNYWKVWLHNDIQYVNRVQRPEWLQFFENAGFTLVFEECTRTAHLPKCIASDFYSFPRSDLEVVFQRIIHTKGTNVSAKVLPQNTNVAGLNVTA